MKLKSIILTISLLILATLAVGAVLAAIQPTFPSCTAPQGVLKVYYPEGIHGIVGKVAGYNGSDSVYSINNQQSLQCYCSVSGQGIQTNWWRVVGLHYRLVSILRFLGWIYIPNGSVWGLEETPYLAKNIDYPC